MAGDVVIRAAGLTKRYGPNLAVDHIDFEVAAGEIVGILGPNGSAFTCAPCGATFATAG